MKKFKPNLAAVSRSVRVEASTPLPSPAEVDVSGDAKLIDVQSSPKSQRLGSPTWSSRPGSPVYATKHTPRSPVSHFRSPSPAKSLPVVVDAPSVDTESRSPAIVVETTTRRIRRLTESSSTPSVRQIDADGGAASIAAASASLFDRRRKDHVNKFKSGVPNRSDLTMFDLIFYNPKDGEAMPEPQLQSKSGSYDFGSKLASVEEMACVEPDSVPQVAAPQVKIGSDGQLIVDESSTLIETNDARKGRVALEQALPEIEDNQTVKANFNVGRKSGRSSCRSWTSSEDIRFFKALCVVGTDFSLMSTIFKGKTRRDLKLKFNREERRNGHLIDMCLAKGVKFDMSILDRIAHEKTADSDGDSTDSSLLQSGGPTVKKRRRKKRISTAKSPPERKRRTQRRRQYYASSHSDEDDANES